MGFQDTRPATSGPLRAGDPRRRWLPCHPEPSPSGPVEPPRPTLTLSQHRHVAEPVTLRISGPERPQLPQGRPEEKLKLPDSHAGEAAAAAGARSDDVSEARLAPEPRGGEWAGCGPRSTLPLGGYRVDQMGSKACSKSAFRVSEKYL